MLTIASMIEKEAAVESERPLIAAVIYNRLHARMPLGIDATIRYGARRPGHRVADEGGLSNPTPYNTRLHRGLPPAPISNPGLASMQAAAHPAKVDYLYFVAKPDKRHHSSRPASPTSRPTRPRTGTDDRSRADHGSSG